MEFLEARVTSTRTTLTRGAIATALTLALVAALAPAGLAITDPPSEARAGFDLITAANLRAHLSVLASEAMQGREAASPQLDIAADYAAATFSIAGVEPAGDWVGTGDNRTRSYFQTFDVVEVTPKSQSLVLETRVGDVVTRHMYEPNVDFTLNGTASVERSAPLVFVGYGLKVPDANWDDYAGVDVKNKFVVAIDGAPGEGKADSWFYKPENRRRYFGGFSSIYKAMAAGQAGALGLIVVSSPTSQRPPLTRDLAENRPAKPSPFATNVRNLPSRREMALAEGGGEGMTHGGFDGVATVKVTERVANDIFAGTGATVASLQSEIDSKMKSRSMPITTSRLTVGVEVDSRVLTTRNVVGMVRGADSALANEVVMIGAHYDHDGARGGYVWPGADDNGSGSSAVLEIARAFARNKVRPKRTTVFALWSGEEKGLLGSKYYTDHPAFPLDKTVTYINLDMIGRDGDPSAGGDPHASMGATRPIPAATPATRLDPANWMSVEGSTAFPSLQTTTESHNASVGLALTYKASDMRFGASDHLYFARRGVPILSYFDGGHDDYHQPTDTIDKINFPKMEKVARLCYLTMWDIASATARPARQEAAATAKGN
jgi:hypothetical protein